MNAITLGTARKFLPEDSRRRFFVALAAFAALAASYAMLGLLWSAAAAWLANPVLLPSVSATANALLQLIGDGSLLRDVAASLRRVLVGFGLALVCVVPLAIVMSQSTPVRRLLMPIVQLLRPIPPIAWIPLAILWLGLGDPPSYLITAIAAFFPIFLNSFQGGVAVELRHLHAARFLGAGRMVIMARIVVPSAMPYIWTGVTIGLGQSWMAVVTAELIAAQSGLGYMIQASRLNLETSSVLVGMVTIGVMGSCMAAGLRWLERFVLPWQANR